MSLQVRRLQPVPLETTLEMVQVGTTGTVSAPPASPLELIAVVRNAVQRVTGVSPAARRSSQASLRWRGFRTRAATAKPLWERTVSAAPPQDHSPGRSLVWLYGDSFVAGMHGCPADEMWGTKCRYAPFGPSLQAALRDRGHAADVKHYGYPGYTSRRLLEAAQEETGGKRQHDLPRLLHAAASAAAVVMAGFYDLTARADVSEEEIASDIWALHESAHEMAVPTVAVGIPLSLEQDFGWRDGKWMVARGKINKLLRARCKAAAPICTYADFPLKRSGARQTAILWDADRMHLSQVGYEEVGRRLAPAVSKVIRRAAGQADAQGIDG